jgi:hypothetical protein
MKWHRYDMKTTPQYEPMDIELDEPEVGLESNQRVMMLHADFVYRCEQLFPICYSL